MARKEKSSSTTEKLKSLAWKVLGWAIVAVGALTVIDALAQGKIF
jgi:hypothetical protein